MGIKSINRIVVVVHWIIMALCVYAVFCCGFHLLPVWGYSENYETINATWLSIALSYIIGYVIYMFTSALPRKQRENEVFALWEPHLTKLYNEMSERIEEVRAYADILEKNMHELKNEDADALARYTTMRPAVYIDKTVDRNESQPLKMIDEFNIKSSLNRHYDTINHILNTMLNNPMAVDADKRLLDILSQIKSSRFLEECTRMIDVSQLDEGHNISTPELPKAYVEYVLLQNKLKRWKFPKFKYSMRKLSEEEEKEMHKGTIEQLARMGTTLKEVREFGQKLTNASRKK